MLGDLKNYTNNLVEIINKYEAIQKQLSEDKFKEVEKLKEELEYEFADNGCESL